jgi:hypothetical protein
MRRLVILIIAIATIVSSATPAAAAVEGLLARSADDNYHLYDYQELLDSYALKLIGNPNGLYEDYSRKSPAAFLHSGGAFIDYKATVDYYAAVVLSGLKFDFNSYAQSTKSIKRETPDHLLAVTFSQGKLISHALGSNIKNSNNATIPPDPTAVGVAIPSEKTPAAAAPAAEASQQDKLSGIAIIGASKVSLVRVQGWAESKGAHPRFIEIAPVYWEYGQLTGICPEVLFAQAAHETRYGHFTGQVPPTFNNWAGIKTANASGDKPEDHEQFATPQDGVRAHFNHIAAYVGLSPIGEQHSRYFVVKRLPWSGTIKTVEELSGKWAPSATYHQRIVLFLSEMKQYPAGVNLQIEP